MRKLISADYNKFYRMIQDFRPTEFTENQFIQTLSKIENSSEIWIIEENNEIIATGTIIYEHKFIFNLAVYAHIEDICVKKEYRRKGIGKLIVKKLIERAQEMKCYKITLDCSNNNVEFYKRNGFEVRGNQMSQLVG